MMRHSAVSSPTKPPRKKAITTNLVDLRSQHARERRHRPNVGAERLDDLRFLVGAEISRACEKSVKTRLST